jgi:hypothetical protein
MGKSCLRGFSRRIAFVRGGSAIRNGRGLARKRALGDRRPSFALERLGGGLGATGIGFVIWFFAFGQVALGVLDGSFGRFSWLGGRQFDAGAARFGEADGDRLLRRSRAMFALPNVIDRLFDEFARLSGGRFSLALVSTGALKRFFLGHG